MKVTALKTPLIEPRQELWPVIKASLKRQFPNGVPEGIVLAVTSKIISYEQGRLVKVDKPRSEGFSKAESLVQKHDLVRSSAEYFLEPNTSKYDLMMTVTDATLTVNAGIDESNADGHYILWPENLDKEAEKIWRKLREEFCLKEVGVIITDSRSFPLRWGVVGMALATCGFMPLVSHIGEQDLFGREIEMVQVNVGEALASSAVLAMGEVAECMPLAVIEDCEQVEFMDRPLNEVEQAKLRIKIEDDMYGPLLNSVEWQRKES